MTKKFDVVIGNPPYQGESTGDATHAMPIYHEFMEAAYEVGTKAILITPARFLFNAGYTPKAWNEKMLADPHLSVPHYAPDSDDLFPGTGIKGGIAVTYRDAETVGEPIGAFTKFNELNDILHRVEIGDFKPITSLGFTSGRSYRYTARMHEEHPAAVDILSHGHEYVIGPHAFQRLPQLFHDSPLRDGHAYTRVLGLEGKKREFRWIRSDYVSGTEALGTYKVAVAAANGSGHFGEALSSPLVLEPDVAVTQTFLTIGSFGEVAAANACLKYIKTKFARTLLGVLKITQHNPAKVWKHVPAQDFSSTSDIDWTKSVAEIDRQLYAKYELTPEDIDFIETQIKPME